MGSTGDTSSVAAVEEAQGVLELVPHGQNALLAAEPHRAKSENCGSHQQPVPKLGLLRTLCQASFAQCQPLSLIMPCRSSSPSPSLMLPLVPACNSLARRAGKGTGSK